MWIESRDLKQFWTKSRNRCLSANFRRPRPCTCFPLSLHSERTILICFESRGLKTSGEISPRDRTKKSMSNQSPNPQSPRTFVGDPAVETETPPHSSTAARCHWHRANGWRRNGKPRARAIARRPLWPASRARLLNGSARAPLRPGLGAAGCARWISNCWRRVAQNSPQVQPSNR